VDVADKPVKISLQVHSAASISGTVEIEHDNDPTNQITPHQIAIQLTSGHRFGFPPQPTQANEDGSFTVKSVLPGEWRIRVMAPNAFIKSAWFGTTDVTNRPLDLTSGAAAPLRLVVSTKTATVHGTAPAGQMVVLEHFDQDDLRQGSFSAQVDSNGQFTVPSLAPGRYRAAVVEPGNAMPEEGGQELTVHEGETVTMDIKPETKPE
jgi:hypothetical protein